jgi:hypothetical protein
LKKVWNVRQVIALKDYNQMKIVNEDLHKDSAGIAERRINYHIYYGDYKTCEEEPNNKIDKHHSCHMRTYSALP